MPIIEKPVTTDRFYFTFFMDLENVMVEGTFGSLSRHLIVKGNNVDPKWQRSFVTQLKVQL